MILGRRHFAIMVGAIAATVGGSNVATAVVPTEINQGGGQAVRSPDGRSVVRSRAGDDSKPGNDPRRDASLWLHKQGARPRLLTHFNRSGYVDWTPDSRRIVFLAEGVQDMQLHLFDLSAPSAPPLAADHRIRALMRLTAPRLQVQTHLIRILRIGRSSMTVNVEESGLPPGASAGRYIGRRRDIEITFSPLNIR